MTSDPTDDQLQQALEEITDEIDDLFHQNMKPLDAKLKQRGYPPNVIHYALKVSGFALAASCAVKLDCPRHVFVDDAKKFFDVAFEASEGKKVGAS